MIGRLLRPPGIWFLFGLYAGFLFIMTHWPRLTIPIDGRPDLLVHASLFAAWTGLLIACGRFGSPLSGKNIRASLLVGVVYSAFDEASQAIPFVQRNAAWDDWACDLAGVVAACGIALLLARVQGGVGTRGPSPTR